MKKLMIFLFIMLFSVSAFADMGCLKNPDKQTEESQSTSTGAYQSNQNPIMDVIGCAAQGAFEGPASILGSHCACMQAVTSQCIWKWKKGNIVGASIGGPATEGMCMFFAPVFN